MAGGALLARFAGFNEGHTDGLSKVVFWFGMPAVLIGAFITSRIGTSLEPVLALAIATALIATLLIVRVAMALLGFGREEQAGAAMAGALGNSTFLAFPLVQFVFGSEALLAGATVLLVDNLILMPIAVMGLAGSATAAGPGAWAQGIRSAVANPIVLASALGLALSFAPSLPVSALRTLDLFAAAATPAALIALGATLVHNAREPSTDSRLPVVVATLARLILAPALVWTLCGWLGVEDLPRAVATLATAAPVAVNVFVQARAYKAFARGAAASVALSTLLSAATLATLITLLT
jgi:predicted permease